MTASGICHFKAFQIGAVSFTQVVYHLTR